MLDKIANKIQTYSGKPPVAELRKAAVLIAVTESDEPELIYTLRSNKVGTHGGEVSFPGGMYEKEDVDLENTALRETCLLYTSPSPRDGLLSRMPSSA